MRPPKKLQVFANFLPQKMLQTFIILRNLHTYLRQTIFCSSDWKWSVAYETEYCILGVMFHTFYGALLIAR